MPEFFPSALSDDIAPTPTDHFHLVEPAGRLRFRRWICWLIRRIPIWWSILTRAWADTQFLVQSAAGGPT